MEERLIEHNKRHLQHMAKEGTLPSTEAMKEAISFNGQDGTGDRILRSEVTTELDRFS